MENRQYSEDIRSTELITQPTVERRYGTRVTGKDLRMRQQKLAEAYEYKFLPDITEWDDRTRESLLALQPRIIIPIELASDVRRIEEVVQSVPYLPHPREGNNAHSALVAAGVSTHTILYTDDPNHLHDDAVRYFLKNLAYDIEDPTKTRFETKMNGFVREKGLEKAFIYGSNAMTMLKIFPQLAFPLMVARGVLNAREIAYNHVIPRIESRFERLQDPDVIARLMRLTKPFLEKTDDHEFEEAVVLLKAPEILKTLKEQDITGRTVAFVDREHASGVNHWSNPQAQEQTFTRGVKSMIAIRNELAEVEARTLGISDWEEFASELTKFFGKYKVYKVGARPHARTLAALQHALPAEEYTSERVQDIIRKTFIAEGVLPRPEHESTDHGWSHVNNF